MNIIDGKKIAEEIGEEIKKEVVRLKQDYDITPGLAVILVGDNPASVVYVRNKRRMCEKLGIYSEEHRLPADVGIVKLMDLINYLNHNPKVHGILVQLPLPEGLNADTVIREISMYKDVDGFSPVNMGRLLLGNPVFVPCTPLGVQELLKRSGISPNGKNVTIIGRSNIVGKPLAALLMQRGEWADATVTVCHSRTEDLPEITRRTDILVVAMGKPMFVTGEMVKEGAVVIDVGINRVEDLTTEKGYRLVGDVDFDSVAPKCSYITKVPGGVGPMTVAMLMYNTVKAARICAGEIKI